ncbi:hypothetical protein PHLGIDRAFT_109789 [Phlebiopsis gigantea 11061_1 CR5-6]|uniref:Decapping nuclease n=1 Tax=Phlebiopsis gigantea (strain 11061_1 CR5-6) TaxID=745531 RepID=A0A0C3S6T2_PHLG1|nr:hypothetical protein PHLGIDRAFT_109789 [Phlebiopsis gigantea 11061_1 CR5-6]
MASRKRPIEDTANADRRTRLRQEHSPAPDVTLERRFAYPPKDRHPPPVPFQQPSTLLTFSYTPERVLEYTDSALRYYVEPPPRADLKYGYDRWIKRPEERGRLDGLLQAVAKYRSKIDGAGGDGAAWLREIAVVSWRGVITKILTAPYEDHDGWALNVMLVDGTLYFEEHLTETKLQEKEDMTPHHRLQSYYGYSFESYCTSSTPQRKVEDNVSMTIPLGWGGDVDTNVQWCAVVKTKLGNQRLVIGGEVDCVRGGTKSLVELKTSVIIRNPQDETRFEKKLLKFYFQSFLLGVPEIIVGFRTLQGQVSTIQPFKTIEIPRLVRGKPNAWDPTICLDWGDRFLAFLKRSITAQTESLESEGVWRVVFSPGSGVTLSRLDAPGVEEVKAGEDRVGFLPSQYFQDITARSLSQDGTPTPGNKADDANDNNQTPTGADRHAGWKM